MKTPEQIIAAAQTHGDRRSAVYWRGALDVLRLRMHGEHIKCPYQAGTVEFDAYFAGNDRGHQLWRDSDDVDVLDGWDEEAQVPTFLGKGRNQGRNGSDLSRRLA